MEENAKHRTAALREVSWNSIYPQQTVTSAVLFSLQVYSSFDIDGDGGVGWDEMMLLGESRQTLGHKVPP